MAWRGNGRRARLHEKRDGTGTAWLPALLCLSAGLLPSGPARADIYAFVDDGGVTHFSNVPQDQRYRLFLRTPDSSGVAPALRRGRGTPPARLYNLQVKLAGQAHQVDAALIHAVISAESGYNPQARSRKGAMGLMQLMPETARRYCVDDPYDPVQNIRGGALYLRDLMRQFDSNLPLVLAAYNAGEAAVLRHGKRVPPYAETRQYVPRVMGLYARYRGEPGFDPTTLLPPTAAGGDPCRRTEPVAVRAPPPEQEAASEQPD